jgi:hypothetical protein
MGQIWVLPHPAKLPRLTTKNDDGTRAFYVMNRKMLKFSLNTQFHHHLSDMRDRKLIYIADAAKCVYVGVWWATRHAWWRCGLAALLQHTRS